MSLTPLFQSFDIPTKQVHAHQKKLETKAILKERRLREIIALLKNKDPLETKEIAAAIPNITTHTTNRYLEELLGARNIRKVRPPGRPKNIKAYEYWGDSGSKTDIVSAALSHPLHQIITSIVKRPV